MKIGGDQGVKSANDVVMTDEELEAAKKVLRQKTKVARRAITMEANQ